MYKGTVRAGVGLGSQGDLTTLALALQTQSIDSFLPQQRRPGGTRGKIDRNVQRRTFDITWVNWGAYVPPVTQIHTTLDVPPPRGGVAPLGITPARHDPARHRLVLPIEVHDRVVPHLGVEWRALGGASWEGFVRGGYEYARSPIGAQTGATNYVDRDRHSLSAGLGVRLEEISDVLLGDVRFDIHAQVSILPSTTTLKSDPSDLVGDMTAGGHIWNFGAAATVGF